MARHCIVNDEDNSASVGGMLWQHTEEKENGFFTTFLSLNISGHGYCAGRMTAFCCKKLTKRYK